MTLSYTSGLTLGSVLAYLLAACLGPRVTLNEICKHPRPSLFPTLPSVDHYANASARLLPNYYSSINHSGNFVSTIASVFTKATKKAKSTKLPKIRTTTITNLLSTALFAGTATNSYQFSPRTEDIIYNVTNTAIIPQILENVTSISNEVLRH